MFSYKEDHLLRACKSSVSLGIEGRNLYTHSPVGSKSPQTAPLPFLLGFLYFPKYNQQLNRIWHKRFLLYPFSPINRTWQGKTSVTVNSTANSIKDGPSGVKINQDSIPSEGEKGAGKEYNQLLVIELDNHMHQEIVHI